MQTTPGERFMFVNPTESAARCFAPNAIVRKKHLVNDPTAAK
jgi:hypothetical protein